MKLKLIIFFYIIFITVYSYSQSFTTVTGTVQDSSGQAWSIGSITAVLTPRQGVPLNSLRNQGSVITNTTQSVFLDSLGAFSLSLDNNLTITPIGSSWTFTVCPNTTYQCTTFAMTISGASLDISSVINSKIIPLSINGAVSISRAYNDVEAIGGNGAFYWRTSDNSLRQCQALPNQTCGGGGSGVWIAGTGGPATPPGNPFNSVQINNAGAFDGVSLGVGQQIIGTSGRPISQSKPVIDPRDYAIDCTGVAASDTVITNAIAAGPHVVFPQNCIVRISSPHTYASPTVFEFKQGARLKLDAGVIVTINNPPIAGEMQRIYDISNTGSWIVNTNGDIQIPWYGVDCTGVTDSSTILNVITGTVSRVSNRRLLLPINCNLTVFNNWKIHGQENLTVDGHGVNGQTGGATINGATTGTLVLPINRYAGTPLDRTGWVATADSYNTESPVSDGFPTNPPSNAITNGTSTCTVSSCHIWLTCYIPQNCLNPPVKDPLPHWIAINMGAPHTISQFQFTPRQDSALGNVVGYQIQTDTTCSGTWVTQATGIWPATFYQKVANFTPISTQCVRLFATATISGIYAAAYQINLSNSIPPAWTASADSFNPSNPVNNALNVYPLYAVEDPTTYFKFWKTNTGVALPHNYTINMGQAYTVGQVSYTPPDNGNNTGIITGYQVQTSNDPACAAGFVTQTTGSWSLDISVKTASFAPVSTQCVKIIATSTGDGTVAGATQFDLFPSNSGPAQISGGGVIQIIQSGYGLYKGFTLNSGVTGSSSNFDTGIESLNLQFGTYSGGFTTTHNRFQDLTISPGTPLSLPVSYNGVYIHLQQNQEMFDFNHVAINCNLNPFSAGLKVDDNNADSTKIEGNSSLNNCYRGIYAEAGTIYVANSNLSANGGYSLFGSGGATFYSLGGCIAEMHSTVLAESSGQLLNTGLDQITTGCATNQDWHDNQISFSDIDPTVYPINWTSGGSLRIANNGLSASAWRISPGTDSLSVTNGVNAFSISGPVGLNTGDVGSTINVNGVNYVIATQTGNAGTFSIAYAGATATGVSMYIIGTGTVIHNEQVIGSDTFPATQGFLTDQGDNILSSPLILTKTPWGGRGEFHPRVSRALAQFDGLSSYSTNYVASNNGQPTGAYPAPFLTFSSGVVIPGPNTPTTDKFGFGVLSQLNGTTSTFAFVHKQPNNVWATGHAYAFDAPISGLQLKAVPFTPSLNTITQTGIVGATSYTYKIVANASNGSTAASAGQTIATGSAVLAGLDCNNLAWTAEPGLLDGAGVWGYDVYRTASGGTPATIGKIATVTPIDINPQVSSTAYTLKDCGLPGDGATPPSVNTADGSLDAAGHIKGTSYATQVNCSATGTSANPSVVSCTSASAGAFSCAVAASGGTCTVNTSAVTANSEIFVQEVGDEGARLGVTCNLSPTGLPVIVVASKIAATSFTINVPTIAVNPACYDYHIVN